MTCARNPASRVTRFLLVAVVPTLTGCFFPTLQTATVRDRVHVSAGGVVLADQRRTVSRRATKEQGADYLIFVSPSFGFGLGRGMAVELGAPFGVYGEDLTGRSEGCTLFNCFGPDEVENGVHRMVAPYAKVGLWQDRPDRFAGTLSPGGVGLIYSHESRGWEPYLAAKRMFTFGDPTIADAPRVVSRFQEDDQSIWVFTTGVERRGPMAFGLELGIVSNAFAGTPTLYDVYVGVRLTR